MPICDWLICGHVALDNRNRIDFPEDKQESV